jgi:hypothetical protein
MKGKLLTNQTPVIVDITTTTNWSGRQNKRLPLPYTTGQETRQPLGTLPSRINDGPRKIVARRGGLEGDAVDYLQMGTRKRLTTVRR